MTFDHAISFCYPLGAANQGTHDGVWGTDAIAVTCDGTIPRDVGLQTLENTALSWGIIRKSACVLTEITIRKSQYFSVLNTDRMAGGPSGIYDHRSATLL